MHRDYIKMSWSNWSIFNRTPLLVRPASLWSFHLCVTVWILCMCLLNLTSEQTEIIKGHGPHQTSLCSPIQIQLALLATNWMKPYNATWSSYFGNYNKKQKKNKTKHVNGSTKLSTSISAVFLWQPVEIVNVRNLQRQWQVSLLLFYLPQEKNLLTKQSLKWHCWGVRVPAFGQLVLTTHGKMKESKEKSLSKTAHVQWPLNA